MITRIEATRYRCFEQLGVDIGHFQVIVGSNGSGKSTLLDIPGLLGELLRQPNISAAFTERRGGLPPRATSLSELAFRGQGGIFILAVEAKIPQEIAAKIKRTSTKNPDHAITHLRYEVRFEVVSQRELKVRDEFLIAFPMSETYEQERIPLQGENNRQRDWLTILERGPESLFRVETSRNKAQKRASLDAEILALPRILFESEQEFPAARWMHDLLVKGSVFFAPDWNGLRMASPPGLSDKLLPSGKNIPWLALALSQKQPDRFQDWVDHVKTALPQVDSIAVQEREEDHHAYFIVRYLGGYSVTSSGLSDGTLRILTLTLLPYLENQPSLLVVEEPEDGIHPRAIEAILQSLSSLYDSQVWLSSHSPIVLASVPLKHVLCARLQPSGAMEVIPGPKHPQLSEWKGAIDLGSLFAAGVLG